MESLIEQAKQLRAGLESYGMVKLSGANNVVDSTGLALPVTEKNPDIAGTLAREITSKSIYLGVTHLSDYQLQEVPSMFEVPEYKPYIFTNNPAGTNEYIHGGAKHVVIGFGYSGGKYGFQVSFGVNKILKRSLSKGIWGDWVEVT